MGIYDDFGGGLDDELITNMVWGVLATLSPYFMLFI